jgi:hypothetical protein
MGFLLMDPFAMLVYISGPHHPHKPWAFSLGTRLDAEAIYEQHES